MTYTDLQLLRKEIADDYKYAFDTQTGDGETTIFKLSHGKIKSSSYEVYVDNDLQTEGDDNDYTIDQDRGIVTFKTAPGDEKEVEVKYDYSAFSDEELTELLALDIIVLRTALHCLDILLFDTSRRFDYASGQTEMKPSQVFRNLLRLRATIEKRLGSSQYGNVAVVNRSNRFYETGTEEETDLSRADLGEEDE